MLVYCQLLYVLLVLLGVFMDFLPLTYWQDATVSVSVFFCFWFKKSYKGNILGNDKGSYFTKFCTRRLQKPEGDTWGRPGGPTPPPGAGTPLGAPGRGVAHLVAPRLRPFAYILPRRKNLSLSLKPPEKFRRRRHIEAKFRGTEVSVPAPCRDGEVPPEGSPSTPPPSPSPLLTPMMRSE